MRTATQRSAKKPPSAAWHGLPPVMRVLYITCRRRTGRWLAEAFTDDAAVEVHLEEAMGTAAGLARLRDEVFDAVLVSHEPGELDALELVAGYRAGGADEPIIVLGVQSEQEMASPCFEAGADAYVCANTTTTRTLIWVFARAVQRSQLIRENRLLNEANRQRLQREHDEAERLLVEQRTLIGGLEALRRSMPGAGSPGPSRDLPGASSTTGAASGMPHELVCVYRELLRTYVIMGSGNLGCEISRLADLLATAGLAPREAMQLHLHVLEELIHGLGTRSARHVMTRADLLIMEIMIHLAECYRIRYRERINPPSQAMLPGFEFPRDVAF